MIIKTILLSLSLITSVAFSKNLETSLKSNQIKPNYNHQLTGDYPTIPLKEFTNFNDSIKSFIKVNFDTKDNAYPTEISFEQLYKNEKFISFSIDYNISNATERYFSKYYTVSLNNKKEITLSDYLKLKNSPEKNLYKALNNFIKPCQSSQKLNFEYCSDMALQSLLESNNGSSTLDIKKNSGFFLKNNDEIGIGFNSNKFTTMFVYNIKKQKISMD